MRISTIVPAYNRADLIGETLQSLLSQSRPPDEIIVVDDGSTDGTADAAAAFGQAITLIRQPNAGAAAARNLGFATSTGDVIHFMDSDDLAAPDWYRIQAGLIAEGNDIVYGPWLRVRFDGRRAYPERVVVQQRPVSGKHALDTLVLCGDWLTVFQPCLFRRTILDAAGPYRTELHTAEDIELLYRLTRLTSRIAHAADSLILYRVHPENQLSQQNIARRAVDFARLWSIFERFAKERDDLAPAQRRSLRYRKLAAAAEVRPYAPEFAEMLEADCKPADHWRFRARALWASLAARVRLRIEGHNYYHALGAGRVSAAQRDQIAQMGYLLPETGAVSQAGTG